MFASLDELKKDPKTAEKANVWGAKADNAKKLSDDMYQYIVTLQEKLKKEADKTNRLYLSLDFLTNEWEIIEQL